VVAVVVVVVSGEASQNEARNRKNMSDELRDEK
jgi:hypothetical protein